VRIADSSLETDARVRMCGVVGDVSHLPRTLAGAGARRRQQRVVGGGRYDIVAGVCVYRNVCMCVYLLPPPPPPLRPPPSLPHTQSEIAELKKAAAASSVDANTTREQLKKAQVGVCVCVCVHAVCVHAHTALPQDDLRQAQSAGADVASLRAELAKAHVRACVVLCVHACM
jgi:hypothetical protein